MGHTMFTFNMLKVAVLLGMLLSVTATQATFDDVFDAMRTVYDRNGERGLAPYELRGELEGLGYRRISIIQATQLVETFLDVEAKNPKSDILKAQGAGKLTELAEKYGASPEFIREIRQSE